MREEQDERMSSKPRDAVICGISREGAQIESVHGISSKNFRQAFGRFGPLNGLS
jgi:hypothetical protein